MITTTPPRLLMYLCTTATSEHDIPGTAQYRASRNPDELPTFKATGERVRTVIVSPGKYYDQLTAYRRSGAAFVGDRKQMCLAKKAGRIAFHSA